VRKSAVEKYVEKQRARISVTHLSGVDDFLRLMLDDRPDMAQRIINPTQREAILCDDRYVAYMGPAGCAKTTTGVASVVFKALMMPGTKWFIARKNYNDLLDTTYRTFTDVLNRLPEGTLLERSKSPPMKVWLKPMAIAGQPNEGDPSEITFMGLTDNVGSYEFNGGFIDEADEVEEHYVQQLKGRLRHKPYADYPDKNYFVMLAFNPPAVTHWLYTACTGQDASGNEVATPWLRLFRPQPRENQRNLPTGYYESMTASLPEDLRQRLVDGVWGSTFPGAPVIRQFKRSTHVRKLKYQGGTLFRFQDYGYRHPGCLWAQARNDGRLEVLRELQGSNLEGTKFVDQILRVTAEEFPRATKFIDFGDPAVAQQKDTGQMLAILANAGILVRYQRVSLELSLNLLRKRFEMMTEGEPAILIDESCRMLIDGLAGGYHFAKDGITPFKGLFDHLVDALRYGVFNLFGSTITSTQHVPTSVAYWSKQ
jgi:hypothetical protein